VLRLCIRGVVIIIFTTTRLHSGGTADGDISTFEKERYGEVQRGMMRLFRSKTNDRTIEY